MRRSSLLVVAALGLVQAGCANGVPGLGLSACDTGGIGIGAAGGALAGGLIGRSWTGAAVGGLVGGALGFLTSRAFAHQLGCADQHRLARDTQLAATAPKGHRISYAPARTSDGQKVSGYVMPVSNWYTDAQGRKVRDVRQVLSDGQHTQTSTVQVAQNDLAPGQKGYVMPQ